MKNCNPLSANLEPIGGSFRDPSGFVFRYEGKLYRQINQLYRQNYDLLMESGLYYKLIREELLIPHEEEVSSFNLPQEKIYKVIKPILVPFVSYPYEWTFSQLKDAALTTLRIQKHALNYGMSLKDASAYNIQFYQGKPILIDTLSFTSYDEGKPWVAYRQFCQFFLAPLALMSYKSPEFGRILSNFIEGIPLDLASQLLPVRSWFRPGLFMHIHLHRLMEHWASDSFIEGYAKNTKKEFSKKSFLALIDNLYDNIENFKWAPKKSTWSDYYSSGLYSPSYLEHKENTFRKFLEVTKPKSVWDLGSNTGHYSQICADEGIITLSFDRDPWCVEINYLEGTKKHQKKLLPLILDLTNPSPAIGWINKERYSLLDRGPVDLVVGLALLHHLAISNNLPFGKIAEFIHLCSKRAIIEFTPKHDPQVQKLLRFRQDIFLDYTQTHFEAEFARYFKIIESIQLNDSLRTLYLLES